MYVEKFLLEVQNKQTSILLLLAFPLGRFLAEVYFEKKETFKRSPEVLLEVLLEDFL